MFFFDNTKKASTNYPSSSKAISIHPLQNDKPHGDPDSRYHDSQKEESTTVFPRKETQTTPPESVHVSSHRVRQTSMDLTKEKKELQSHVLAMQDILDTTLNTSEAARKKIERLKEEVQRLDSIVTSTVAAEELAGSKNRELEKKVLQQDENIRNLEQKLRISEEQRLQTTKILDERTAELKGAQAFLTTADQHSGADIIKMAESWNAEIFQASAMMAARKEIERLKEEVQRLDSIMTSTAAAEELAGSKNRELEKKVLQQDENIRNLEQKLRVSEEQRSQTTKMLDERTAELKGAQAFLTTDQHSGADIIKIPESLNAKNLQASAMMAAKKEIERLKEEVRRFDSIVTSTVSAEELAGRKIRELEKKVSQQDKNIRNLEQKLRISEEQCSQKTKMLDERTAELKGAQASLTTADRYSEADIIKMAESLNAEIFQASAMMAELLVDVPVIEDSVQRREYMQKYKKYLEHSRKEIGSQLFDHLETKSREIREDPLPLQLAFQAFFTAWCVHEVDQFCEGETGESLKQIYKRICKSETQAVAGKWRSLTSVQTMNSDTPSNASHIYFIILSLMSICGGFVSQDAKQKAKLSVQQAVLRVEKIWKTLKTVLMQEITTAEIIMISIGPESDYNAAKMDNMYIDASSDEITKNPDNHGQHILCSVGVGLQRNVSKQCQDGTMQINGEVILKPKIALPSVLLKVEPSPDTHMMLDGKD